MLKILFLATGLSIAPLAANADPFAGLRSVQTEAVVATRGVDFGDAAQVRTLHEALGRFAVTLCDSRNPRDLGVAASDRACARDALDRVVATINQPLLTALHQGRTMAAPDAQLASR